MPTTTHDDWKKESLAALKALRDEIRLDLHLAGMDAKDEWKRLEPKLHEAERLAEDIGSVSRKAVEEIVDRVREFRRSLQARA